MLASIGHALGACRRLRGALPQVPEAGATKAAGLIQAATDWPPGAVKGTPGTRSGR